MATAPGRQSDRDGIHRSGALARTAGAPYFDNPHFFTKVPLETVEQMDAWLELTTAWAGGWLEVDAGRDRSLQRMLNLRYW